MAMHKCALLMISTVIFPMLLMVGCSATPQKPLGKSIIFRKPALIVQKAAIDSLVVNGFEVQKTESLYVEGFRPRRIGAFVGSGGETVGVWLDELSELQTEVRVQTAKSLAGIVGQRNWNAEILDEMTKALGKPE